MGSDEDTLILLAIAGLIGIGVGFAIRGYIQSQMSQNQSEPTPKTTYNNLEEWEFVKEGRRVVGVKVHRHAETC